MIDRKKAKSIFLKIKSAKRILLCVHVSPDLDSLASCLAMDLVLNRLGKKTKIISYSQIPSRFSFLPGVEKIETADFAKIDLSGFDLFLVLDCAQERMITRSLFPKNFPKNFKIINIDHHFTNVKFGDLNLVALTSSTAELLYELFLIWKIKIDKKLAELLLFGLVSDTGCFRYSLTTQKTLEAGAELMKKGAVFSEVVLRTFRSYNFKTLKYWGKILDNLQIEEKLGFVWSKISKAECEELGITPVDIDGAADQFLGVVEGTKFGLILNEESENYIRGSLRSRDGFDVSRIAQKLGGGGHKAAAGFSLEMCLAEAEEKVLAVIREELEK